MTMRDRRLHAASLFVLASLAVIGCADVLGGPSSRRFDSWPDRSTRSSITLQSRDSVDGGVIFAITGVQVDTVLAPGVIMVRTERADSTLALYVGPLRSGPLGEIRIARGNDPSAMRLSILEIAAMNAGEQPRTMEATLRASSSGGDR